VTVTARAVAVTVMVSLRVARLPPSSAMVTVRV
jgi:hypothetical protein